MVFSSFSRPCDQTVTVFGGSGFVGRYIVQRLARLGFRLRVAVRNPVEAEFLKTLVDVGQMTLLRTQLPCRDDIEKALEGATHVINCVGILEESGAQTFERVHVESARGIAAVATQNHLQSLVHISALGADLQSRSAYARSKGNAEKITRRLFPRASFLRPSVIFGKEAPFFRRTARIVRMSPLFPLIGGGEWRFQPVYVDDVAEAAVHLVLKPEKGVFALGGAEVLSLRLFLEKLVTLMNRRCLLLPVPFFAARCMGALLQFLPGKMLTPGQVRLMEKDNVVPTQVAMGGKGFERLGIGPKSFEAWLCQEFKKTFSD